MVDLKFLLLLSTGFLPVTSSTTLSKAADFKRATHQQVLPATTAPPVTGPDTLRSSVRLAEVKVLPKATVVLSSIGRKRSTPHGALFIPGYQYAVLLQPEAGSEAAIIETLAVRLRPNKPTEGRIRIRLVSVVPGASPAPGLHDLLPDAPVYTAAQLAALPTPLLTLNLARYELRLPPEGAYVLVEGLTTDPAETCVPMAKDDPTPWQIITATDALNPATHRRTPADKFPAFAFATSRTAVTTVFRHCHHEAWMPRSSYKPGQPDNLDVSLTLRPE